MKSALAPLAAIAVFGFGIGGGCAGPGPASGPHSTGGSTSVGIAPAVDPQAGPQPISPVLRPAPRTLDHPELSPAEAQARRSTLDLAIQQATRVDQSPLNSNVQVGQEQGKIILRGSVPDEQTRIRVEQAARDATPAGYIDNQIRVEPK